MMCTISPNPLGVVIFRKKRRKEGFDFHPFSKQMHKMNLTASLIDWRSWELGRNLVQIDVDTNSHFYAGDKADCWKPNASKAFLMKSVCILLVASPIVIALAFSLVFSILLCHLFLWCEVWISYSLWSFFLYECGLEWCIPVSLWFSWKAGLLLCFSSFFFWVGWGGFSIWKERNNKSIKGWRLL